MIYFVQRANGDIKIGTTENFQKRFYGLRSTMNEDLIILGVYDGNWATEESLHAQFHEWRREGEWFMPSDTLAEYIKANTTMPPAWKVYRKREKVIQPPRIAIEVSKGWVERLEAHYKEDALTLIPRLLNYYGGMQPLADEAGISLSRLSRWCDENGIESFKVYRRRETLPQA